MPLRLATTVVVLALVALTAPAGASAATCANPAIGTSFATNPTAGTLGAAMQVDCYAVQNVSAGNVVEVRLRGTSPQPSWTIVDANDTTVCAGFNGELCTLSGTGPWALNVTDSSMGTGSYTVAVHRITNPQGCTALPAFSFANQPLQNQQIASTLSAKCYTFSRALGDPDGSYWFRVQRQTGSLTPQWRVLDGTTGAATGCIGSFSGLQACTLQASDQFTLVVDDPGAGTGTFVATAEQLNSRNGCGALPSVAVTSDPASGSIGTAGEIDCLNIPDVSSGDVLEIESATSWAVVDVSGNAICQGFSPCTLTGSGPYSILVFDSGIATPAYQLVTRRLTNPQGCTALDVPAAYGFNAGALTGSLSALHAQCWTFNRPGGQPDAAAWVRALRTSGTLFPQATLYGPTGTAICNGSADLVNCPLQVSGSLTLLVEDPSSTTGTAGFAAAIKQLSAPSGCSAVILGGAPVTGTLSAPGDAHCFTLAGATSGDGVNLTLSGAQRAVIVNGNGAAICYGPGQCTLDGTPGWSVIVYDSDAGTGGFTLGAGRLSAGGMTAPTATTGIAGSLASTTATLHGAVDANGAQVDDCHFDYGTDATYGQSIPCEEAVGAASGVPVSAGLTGLQADTEYHFRLVAHNALGTNEGNDATFRTTPPPEIATVERRGSGLTYAATAGAVNQVRVSLTANGVRFQELDGGRIGTSCPGGQPGADVTCTGTYSSVRVDTGDGDDTIQWADTTSGARAAAALPALVAQGGTGNDRLTGGPDRETLSGGAGNDVVDGGAGADTITGGVGNDELTGGAGADQIQGDDGNDVVDGGAGGDHIDGGQDADQLDGGTGADVVMGAAGDDTMDGGAGSDKLNGGADNDRFTGREGHPGTDQIACGTGLHDLINSIRVAVLGSDCESVVHSKLRPGEVPVSVLGGTASSVEIPTAGGKAKLRIPCPPEVAGARGCSGHVTVRWSRRAVAKATFKVPTGKRGGTITLRLPQHVPHRGATEALHYDFAGTSAAAKRRLKTLFV